MNAASLPSERLQRLLAVLEDGKPLTTRTIMRRANICAINSCVAELRQHGAEITCTRQLVAGKWRFFYTMTKGPTDA